MTFSAGVVECSDATVSAESFLHMADMQMYRAKRKGRDRICFQSREHLISEQGGN